MALRREFLAALGIEAEKIEEIIKAHMETVDAIKTERDGFRDRAEQYDTVKAQLDAVSKYEGLYATEKAAHDALKNTVQTESDTRIKRAAHIALLDSVGIRGKLAETITDSTDLASLAIGADGKIDGADALAQAIKADWADYIPITTTRGEDVKTPPQNTGAKTAVTREQIYDIKDPAQRQAAIAQNIELFTGG